MARWRLIGLVSVAIWGAGLVAPANVYADGYTLEDVKLKTAGELVDMCTVDPQHEHYAVALAFCYGFFEGAVRYAEAIAGTTDHKQLVCAPVGTTRSQAVEAFVSYMKNNPQYQSEGPVDAMYRALIPKWPCPK